MGHARYTRFGSAAARVTQSLSVLFCLSVILESIHQIEVLFESFNGFQSCLEQEPAEHKNAYCQSDFPGPSCLRTPPYQRQCQGAHTANCNDNKGGAEIPLNVFPRHGWPDGLIQEFTAVFTLYRLVLNLFGTEWTLLHYLYLLAERSGLPALGGQDRPRDQKRLWDFRVLFLHRNPPKSGAAG